MTGTPTERAWKHVRLPPLQITRFERFAASMPGNRSAMRIFGGHTSSCKRPAVATMAATGIAPSVATTDGRSLAMPELPNVT